MSGINDGGPAFPVSNIGVHGAYGMALRDYFAAKAMAVVWADIPEDAARDQALNQLGAFAYEMADAMISARSRP